MTGHADLTAGGDLSDRLRSAVGRLLHDLRSPLNTVSGFSQLVRDGFAGPVNAEQTKLLERVAAAVKDMVSAVNEAEFEAEAIVDAFAASLGRAVPASDAGPDFLAMLLDHLPLIVWSTDAETRVEVMLGDALLEAGINPRDVVGRRIDDVPALCEHDDEARTSHAAALAGAAGKFEWHLGARTFLATLSPRCGPAGEVIGTSGVGLDVTSRRWLAEQTRFLARQDPLTELPNRTETVERVDAAIASAHASAKLVAVMAVSLDNFHRVGDSFGHRFSEQLLRLFAHRLSDWLGHDGFLGRAAADTFLAVLPAVSDVDEVMSRARRLTVECGRQFFIDEKRVALVANTGVATYPVSADHGEALVANAEAATPRGKGGDSVRFYLRALQEEAASQLTLANDITGALARNELFLEYQPVVDAVSSAIIGAEALLRWRHPQRGVLGPGSFIGLAEETGAILLIGEWVTRSACAEATRWPSGMHVSVNISPLQFVDSLVEKVAAALEATGLEPSRLQLEVTESTIVHDREKAGGLLRQLRDLGVRLAIDDFGTGFSSLAHLKAFSLDVLKIDRGFVRDIAEDQRDQAIVKAVVSLGASLGMQIVAEGVETPGQVRELRRLGCEAIQGFYFSRPVGAVRLRRMLRAGRVSRRMSA